MFKQGCSFSSLLLYHHNCTTYTSGSNVSGLFPGNISTSSWQEGRSAKTCPLPFRILLGSCTHSNYIQLARTLSHATAGWTVFALGYSVPVENQGSHYYGRRQNWYLGTSSTSPITYRHTNRLHSTNPVLLCFSVWFSFVFYWKVTSSFSFVFHLDDILIVKTVSSSFFCLFVFPSLNILQALGLQVSTCWCVPSFHRWWLCHLPHCSCWEFYSPFPWAPSGSFRLVPTMGSSRCHKFLLRSHRKFRNTSPWANKYLTYLWAKMALPWARSCRTCSMAKSTHIYPNIWRKCSRYQEWARKQHPRKAKVTSRPWAVTEQRPSKTLTCDPGVGELSFRIFLF